MNLSTPGLESAPTITLVAFVAYLLLITAIGLAATRFASAGMVEFFLGGRRLNRYVVALSAVVSGRSAWLLLGFTGLAYTRGVSAVWAAVGYVVVELLLFRFYARRLRNFSEARGCITLPDFFAERFEDRRGVLRGAVVGVILIFVVGYVAGQFVGGGKAFAVGFGLDPTIGILLTAGIVLLYTVAGGFLAVSITDLLQALLMLVALVVLPVVAIVRQGGLTEVVAQLAELDPALVDPTALGAGALLGFLGIGLGSPGNPHILVRFMAIDDADQFPVAAFVGTTWNVLMAWGALFVGLVGRALYPRVEMLPGSDPEALFPLLAGDVFPPLVFGFIVAAIFAAIMSTADSQLLVAASGAVRDIWQKLIHRDRILDDRRLVTLSRWVTVALVVLALVLGFLAEGVVFWLVLFSWAGLGAALGPTSILALTWKRTTGAGVLAGMVAGTTTVIVWELVPALNNRLYELIPAFAVALSATVVVSWLSRPPDDVDRMFAEMDGYKTPREHETTTADSRQEQAPELPAHFEAARSPARVD